MWTKYRPELDKIIDNLYIANGTCIINIIDNKDTLPTSSSNEIIDIKPVAIVNCTPRMPMSKTIKTYRLSVNDRDKNRTLMLKKMSDQIHPAVDFINDNIKNGPVIVHCMAGMNRSATVIAGYFMKYKNMTLVQAIDLIKSKRPKAFTTKGQFDVMFLPVLNEFE